MPEQMPTANVVYWNTNPRRQWELREVLVKTIAEIFNVDQGTVRVYFRPGSNIDAHDNTDMDIEIVAKWTPERDQNLERFTGEIAKRLAESMDALFTAGLKVTLDKEAYRRVDVRTYRALAQAYRD